jgi:hypothetical protein
MDRDRDQWTAMRPIVASTREPLSSRAPLPYALKVKERQRRPPLKRGKPAFSPRCSAAGGRRRDTSPIQAGEHVLQAMGVDRGLFREGGPQVRQLGFLLVAAD